ncbi:MAG: GspB domain-containing protein [Proteobacteria bacterium]|nr:GspB domain-containing protein [Pseudomonadota bacterium]
MSLILEALKRAERERKAQQSPDSGGIFQDKSVSGRRRGTWFWICGVLLVNAIVLALLFRPDKPVQAPAPSDAKAGMEKAPSSSAPAGPARPLFMEARVAQAPKTKREKAAPPKARPGPASADHRPANVSFRQLATNDMGTPKLLDQLKPGPATTYHRPTSIPFGPLATDNDTDTTEAREQFKSEPTGFQVPPAADLPATTSTYIPPSPATPSAVTINTNPIKHSRPKPKGGRQPQPAKPPAVQTPPPPPAPEPAVAKPHTKELPKPIPTINELPFETQKDLQDLQINIHAYSADPKKCFVYINMQRYYAGDRIWDNGPVLEKITPDGAIIRHGNVRALLQSGR